MVWFQKAFSNSVHLKNILHRRFLFPQINFSNNFSVCSNMGVPLVEVVKQLREIAPLKLAESWDNVGLLVEPNRNKIINNVLLTIDLTEDVVQEAIDTKSELIISYHPNIFRPLKQITERYLY